MPRGRACVVLAVAVAVTVLGTAAGVEVQRRRTADARDGAAAARRASADRADQGSGNDGEASQVDDGGDGSDGGDGDGDGLVQSFLDALNGGGEVGGDATTALLQKCTRVLAGVPVGSAGVLPERGKADPAEQLREIATGLQELRMLRFRHVPEPVYVTPDEMSRRVLAEVAASLSPEVAADEARGLISLGALPAGADLHALTEQALGEQVAGYYDTETGELVVARQTTSGGLDGQSRIVLAHELDHALTDQAIGLPADDGQPAPGAEDAALARLALVEGDATLAMQLYGLAYVPLLDQLSGLTGAISSQDKLARLPYHVQQNLLFPYIGGLSLACALHDAGGWAAVDAAYKAPPASTAQVLFPERYLAGEAPVDPRDPSAPGGVWTALPRRAFGAAELQWLLEAPGGDTDDAVDHADQRAAGWAGGELQVWVDGDRTATGVALVQHAGQPALCATMAAWYAAAFRGGKQVAKKAGEALAVDGARQDAVIHCAGADVRIGIAPDLATARTIAG
ncbi:MAG: hypothetical protein ACR2MO_11780 [Acidimicrobiales bacterium]